MVAATFRLRKEATVAASFNLRKQTQAKACGYQWQKDQKALTLLRCLTGMGLMVW